MGKKIHSKEAIELIAVEESAPDLDEDFEAHMAAIEAEEAKWDKDWNAWNEGLLPDEDSTPNQQLGYFTTSEPFTVGVNTPTPFKRAKTCKHHLQPFTFKVGQREYTLYGSAFSDRKSAPKAAKANLCVFLDYRWMEEYSPVWFNPALAQSGSSLGLNVKPETPTIFLDWPDMGVLEIEDLKPVVAYLTSVIDTGVEVGCMGGHGRTGTLMALIMVQLGCKAEEAIKTIRQDYCDRAIETKKQENLIKAFAKEVQG
tara:strand:+ start:180 stop:947 length:768 start_codon:yes stop_codon:yes gene_type:complete